MFATQVSRYDSDAAKHFCDIPLYSLPNSHTELLDDVCVWISQIRYRREFCSFLLQPQVVRNRQPISVHAGGKRARSRRDLLQRACFCDLANARTPQARTIGLTRMVKCSKRAARRVPRCYDAIASVYGDIWTSRESRRSRDSVMGMWTC